MSEQQAAMLEERFEKLSGYIDGELTQQEAQKMSLLIEPIQNTNYCMTNYQ